MTRLSFDSPVGYLFGLHARQRLMRGLVIVLSLGLAGFVAAACQPQMQQASELIAAKLNEKYGQEFVVQDMGGGYGSLDNTTWKATVYPKDDPSLTFTATVKKDLSVVQDYYLGATVARELEKSLENDIQQMTGSASIVRIHLTDTAGTDIGEVGEPGVNPAEYFSTNPRFVPAVWVVIDSGASETASDGVALALATSLSRSASNANIDLVFVATDDLRSLESSAVGVDYFGVQDFVGQLNAEGTAAVVRDGVPSVVSKE